MSEFERYFFDRVASAVAERLEPRAASPFFPIPPMASVASARPDLAAAIADRVASGIAERVTENVLAALTGPVASGGGMVPAFRGAEATSVLSSGPSIGAAPVGAVASAGAAVPMSEAVLSAIADRVASRLERVFASARPLEVNESSVASAGAAGAQTQPVASAPPVVDPPT